MLEEQEPKQNPGEHPRRWFSDDDFDLIVWQGEEGQVTAFQLCNRYESEERAISWDQESGTTFSKVDSGDATAEANRTPILISDGIVPHPSILRRFEGASSDLDREIRSFVLKKIREAYAPQK